MSMYNPPHPGEFIREVYLEPYGISHNEVARKLNVSPSTLNRILQAKSNISPEMALKLSITLGRSPESWLVMQNSFNLWKARKNLNLDSVEKLDIAA